MNTKVANVKTTLVFTFKDGQTYELPLVDKNKTGLQTYGTSVKLKEHLYASSGKNIVGNICCNSLAIELISKDKLLISSNEESIYYGLMNDTAVVDVFCSVEDAVTEFMGRYFVSTWENGTTNSTANNVSISCVDLLSKIKNISLGKIRLKRNLDFNNYLKTIIDTLNKQLPVTMQIIYTDDDLKLFKNSEYDWQMYFNNIDRTDVETIFNTIAQNTISYIWIDRDQHLKTDHLLDDSVDEAVSTLSGNINLFGYGSQSGDIDNYSGVAVTYISNIAYEDKQLLQIKDYDLYKGTNEITNARLNNDKVCNVHHIEIECETGTAICVSFDNYKNSIDMIIEATNKTKATITVFGTIINETTDTLTMYKDDNNKSTLIEIENKLLRKEIINSYTTGLVQLMSMKNNRLYAEGYINPRIRLADLVYVKGVRLGVDAYYKVTGLEFTLGTNYRCKATLLRTIAITPDIESIMYNNIDELYTAVTGDYADVNNIVELNDTNELRVQTQLVGELEQLQIALDGGV